MTKKLKKLFYLSVLSFFSFFLISCGSAVQEPLSQTQLLLGTSCTITIYDPSSPELFDKVFARIKEIEQRMSINLENSEVISINQAAGVHGVNVSEDTFYVIEKGRYYSTLTEGKFDITIGPLVKLWGIGTEKAMVPSIDEITAKKSLVNYKNLSLQKETHEIMLEKKGMILDLGGIAKGYAADEAARILKENGVKRAIVNLGGNILTVGSKDKKVDWTVGVQDPFSPRGDFMGTVHLSDKAVVSSGVYERFLEKDEKRYHHILSPATGYPVENDLVSVSIITPKSIDADSLSTSVFSLGLEEGKSFVEGLQDVEAIFITKDYKVYPTSGLIHNLKITNTKFQLIK